MPTDERARPLRAFPPPSHGLDEESMEAKVQWFRGFSTGERLALFAAWMDFFRQLNPGLLERKRREPLPEGLRGQVLEASHDGGTRGYPSQAQSTEMDMLPQLKRIFAALNRYEVQYLVVDGVAAIVYGLPRATFDLDFWIAAHEENARRLLQALEEVGFGTATLTTPQAVVAHEITVFQDWIRIDVFTRIPGLTFATAWARRRQVRVDDTAFWVLDLDDLIASKKASGRPQDLEDARFLEEQRRTNQE